MTLVMPSSGRAEPSAVDDQVAARIAKVYEPFCPLLRQQGLLPYRVGRLLLHFTGVMEANPKSKQWDALDIDMLLMHAARADGDSRERLLSQRPDLERTTLLRLAGVFYFCRTPAEVDRRHTLVSSILPLPPTTLSATLASAMQAAVDELVDQQTLHLLDVIGVAVLAYIHATETAAPLLLAGALDARASFADRIKATAKAAQLRHDAQMLRLQAVMTSGLLAAEREDHPRVVADFQRAIDLLLVTDGTNGRKMLQSVAGLVEKSHRVLENPVAAGLYQDLQYAAGFSGNSNFGTRPNGGFMELMGHHAAREKLRAPLPPKAAAELAQMTQQVSKAIAALLGPLHETTLRHMLIALEAQVAAERWNEAGGIADELAKSLVERMQDDLKWSDSEEDNWRGWSDELSEVMAPLLKVYRQDGDVERLFRYQQLAADSRIAWAFRRTSLSTSAPPATRPLIRKRAEIIEALRRNRLCLASTGTPMAKSEKCPESILSWELKVSTLRGELDEVTRKILALFPAYEELASVKTFSVEKARQSLQEKQALVIFTPTAGVAFATVVTKERTEVIDLPVTLDELNRLAHQLLEGLSASGRGAVLVGGESKTNWDAAARIHTLVWAPLAEVVSDAPVVHVVATGALSSVPFHALLTAPLRAEAGQLELRTAGWLLRKHAFNVLPTVGQLIEARARPSRKKGAGEFFGFGDPEMGARWSTLKPLPETILELRSLASPFGSGRSQVYLGRNATLEQVRKLDKTNALASASVLAFATHGLLAGELGVREPGLVLSPGTDEKQSDGFLGVSEIARLRLNADLVILSACNTARGESASTDESFSGMARAFQLAGSRSVLVSHWPVDSQSSVTITTTMMEVLARQPEVTVAEALRTSMLSYLDGNSNLHPRYWAPFVTVGRGTRVLAAPSQ
ncbi:MAG: CHAT domain-containing protein [Archangium sp.]|nr:CHAT domain-containing protein [Archangium sp.]